MDQQHQGREQQPFQATIESSNRSDNSRDAIVFDDLEQLMPSSCCQSTFDKEQNINHLGKNDIWLDAPPSSSLWNQCLGTMQFHRLLRLMIEEESHSPHTDESSRSRRTTIAERIIEALDVEMQPPRRWLLGSTTDQLKDVSNDRHILEICIQQLYEETLVKQSRRYDILQESKRSRLSSNGDDNSSMGSFRRRYDILQESKRSKMPSCSVKNDHCSIEGSFRIAKSVEDIDNNDDADVVMEGEKSNTARITNRDVTDTADLTMQDDQNDSVKVELGRGGDSSTTDTDTRIMKNSSFCRLHKNSIGARVLLMIVVVALITVLLVIFADNNSPIENGEIILDNIPPPNRTSLFTGGLVWPIQEPSVLNNANNTANQSNNTILTESSDDEERRPNKLVVTVWNAMDEKWQTLLGQALQQWDLGDPVDILSWQMMPRLNPDRECESIDGALKLCNGNYGKTGWRGYTGVMVNVTTRELLNAAIKINDYYYDLPDVTDGRKMYTLCHELGHGLGLPHWDENPLNDDLGTCMDYTLNYEENAHPNDSNFLFLASLYPNIIPHTSNDNIDIGSTSNTQIVPSTSAPGGGGGGDSGGDGGRRRLGERWQLGHRQGSRQVNEETSLSRRRILLESNKHHEVQYESIDEETGLLMYYLLDN